MNDCIIIDSKDDKISECESVIIIPEIAMEEPGYIQVFTVKDSANAKHEYHAMAQMAYYQYQDDELTLVETNGTIVVTAPQEKVELDAGVVLYRKENGDFNGIVHRLQNKKKLLEAGYRYCTRWVRLDI
ncbi:MAG: hypothetical protein GY702_03370 [Desulfobulbaceae bacterium]|nr:hypothetical protein [Desulfobulbaceae bacterium]